MLILSQNILNGLLIGGLYALIGVGLALIFSVLRVLNFAHGDFLVLGMYISISLNEQLAWNPYLSLVAVIPIGFALGWLIEQFLLSRLISSSEDSSLLLTLGIGLIIQNALQLFFGPEPKSLYSSFSTSTFKIAGLSLSLPQILATLISLAIIASLYFFLNSTDQGRALRATSNSTVGAELVGINTLQMRRFVFAVGTALALVAGVILIPQLFVSPQTTGSVFTLKAFVVTILGGLGNIWGAVAGGVLLGVTEVLGAAYISNNYRDAYGLIVFLLILLFKPQGLFSQEHREV